MLKTQASVGMVMQALARPLRTEAAVVTAATVAHLVEAGISQAVVAAEGTEDRGAAAAHPNTMVRPVKTASAC